MRDKAFNFGKNLKYNGYQWGLVSMVYKFFDKISLGGTVKVENIYNKELAYTNQLLATLRIEKYTHLL